MSILAVLFAVIGGIIQADVHASLIHRGRMDSTVKAWWLGIRAVWLLVLTMASKGGASMFIGLWMIYNSTFTLVLNMVMGWKPDYVGTTSRWDRLQRDMALWVERLGIADQRTALAAIASVVIYGGAALGLFLAL